MEMNCWSQKRWDACIDATLWDVRRAHRLMKNESKHEAMPYSIKSKLISVLEYIRNILVVSGEKNDKWCFDRSPIV
jgi:hypothetical protein